MKKIFLVLFAMGILSTSFVSCREETKVEDAVEDAADDIEDAVD
ncbi:hypothetical protein [Mesonia sp. K7]|nr:hypothetical protein [Mesonia sp. K7]